MQGLHVVIEKCDSYFDVDVCMVAPAWSFGQGVHGAMMTRETLDQVTPADDGGPTLKQVANVVTRCGYEIAGPMQQTTNKEKWFAPVSVIKA